jgi:hypothetical protein
MDKRFESVPAMRLSDADGKRYRSRSGASLLIVAFR